MANSSIEPGLVYLSKRMRNNGGFNVTEPGFEPGAALFWLWALAAREHGVCPNLRGQAGFACREPSIKKKPLAAAALKRLRLF